MEMGLEYGSGDTLSGIYQSAKKLLLSARDGIERLEYSTSMDSPELSFLVKRYITETQFLCLDMDRLWRSVAANFQRDLWRRKVEQVAEEADSLKESLNKYLLRNKRRMIEAKERSELLRRNTGESSHVLRIFDEEAQALQLAHYSSRMSEEAYSTGSAILFKHSEQGDLLKRAQRKALDILNTVGLSNSVLKLTERRNCVDQQFKYAGMILTLVILFLIWRWTRLMY